MVALLDDAAKQAERDNPFYGRDRLAALRAELQRAGAAAPWKLRIDTALAALEHGEERDAIALLEGARDGLMRGTLAGDTAAAIGTSFQLGVACLRLGETENCCAEPTHESCILPLRGSALHGQREGSERAAAFLVEVLSNTPPTDYWHYAAQWLLSLAHQTLGTFPDGVPAAHRLPAAAFVPSASDAGRRWRNVAPDLGLDVNGNAGGVAIDDFDGDDDLDLVVSDWSPRGQLRFFRNDGDGTFTDRTDAAGLTGITGGLNLVHADVENDGDLDVVVLRGGWWFEHGKLPVSLLQNRGDGTFTDVTFAAGLGDRRLPTQTAGFADYDLDGDLDLYVGSESSPRCRCSSQLFRNDGAGRFGDVAKDAGVANDAYAKGVSWGDYDGDRWPDLYVSNIGGDNRLFHNRGDGTFEDVAARAGVTKPTNSFPTWWFDFDNDGALDLFVANYDTGIAHAASHLLGGALPFEHARLYLGDGKGTFRDVAAQAGLNRPLMPMGCNFGDLDHDGWLDVYLGTGDPQYASLMPNVLLRNDGGQRLDDVTLATGTGHLQKGHAVAFADLDADGDQDLFSVIGGAYPGDAFRNVLFENPGTGNHWLAVHVVGRASARCAIGARLCVTLREGSTTRRVFRHVNQGASFGGNPLRQQLGLGRADRIERLEVFWPRTGKTDVFTDVPMDATVRVVEGEARFTRVTTKPAPFRRR